MRSLSPEELESFVDSKEFIFDAEEYSKKVAEYFRRRPEVSNADFLASLADFHFMHHLCPSVSLFFLNLALKYQNDEDFADSESERDTLQQRCKGL